VLIIAMANGRVIEQPESGGTTLDCKQHKKPLVS
jgi:hypothetical protein